MSRIIDIPESETLQHVLAFAEIMEHKLSLNRQKGNREGWLKSNPWELLRRLRDEVVELEEAMYNEGSEAVSREAADVANFAMMVADCFRHHDSKDFVGTRSKVTPISGAPVPYEGEIKL